MVLTMAYLLADCGGLKLYARQKNLSVRMSGKHKKLTFQGGLNFSMCVHSEARPASMHAGHAKEICSTLNIGLVGSFGSFASIMLVSGEKG